MKLITLDFETYYDSKIKLGFKHQTTEEYVPLIEKYKQYQSAIPKTIKNATIIPQFNLGDNTSDGTHPSAKGQQMIADIILKTL